MRRFGHDDGADQAPVDPTLEDDLGAEYDLTVGEQEAVARLAEQLEEARALAAEHLELAQRKQAEFENYRRRVAREQEDAAARACARIVEELLPVIDNIERAIDHVTAGGSIEDLLRGVELVHQQVLDVLAAEGVQLQDPFGKPFDPEFHQAVQQRTNPEVPEGTVVEVYRKGYVMGGRVLRAAQVVVSTGGSPNEEA